MILGLDPIYWMVLGVVGMIVLMTLLGKGMLIQIDLLKEIRDAHKSTSISQNSGPLVTITTTDPLMAAISQGRRESVQPLSTGSPNTEPVGTMDITTTMPRVKP